MSLLSKAALFLLRETLRPALEKVGEHVGNAVGTVLGKKIDPEHGSKEEDDGQEDDGSG